jgi:O-antigen/teichoic acid export membrane protein
MEFKKNIIVLSSLVLVISNAISSILVFMRGTYVAYVLSPSDFGILTLLVTMINYTNYADIGIGAGMFLEVPKLLGTTQAGEAKRIQSQAYIAVLVLGVVSAAFLLLISFAPLELNAFQKEGLRIAAIAVIIFALLNYYQTVVRLHDRFVLIGFATIIGSFVAFAGSVAVVHLSNIDRVTLLALVLLTGSGTSALLLGLFSRTSLAWPMNWDIFLRLIKIGLPVSMLPIVFTLFQTIDRWIVAAHVQKETLGYYSLGAILGSFLYMIPNTLAFVLWSRQTKHFGAENVDFKTKESLFYLPLFFSGYGMALMAGVMMLIMPFVIHYIFSAYISGTIAAIILSIGNCLLFAVPLSSNVLVSVGRQKAIFGLLAVATLMEAVIVYALVQTQWGINGAAIAVLASDMFYSILLTFLTVRVFDRTVFKQATRVALCFVPFVICLPVAGVLMSSYYINGILWQDTVGILWRCVLFGLICIPLCLYAGWAGGAVNHQTFALWTRQLFSS